MIGWLRRDHPAAVSFAAANSEPDRPQAVKAAAIAPLPRGFGLDGLIPPRFGALQADKGGLGTHSAPKPDRYTNHVLGNGCDNARAVDCKANRLNRQR